MTISDPAYGATPHDAETRAAITEAGRAELLARLVQDAIERLKDNLNKQNRELQQAIEARARQGCAALIVLPYWRRWRPH